VVTGDFFRDFFWGTELYIHIGEFNVKQFVNDRFAMNIWSVVGWLCLFKQYDNLGYVTNSMMITVGLQTVYLLKFFWWESGYFNTLDIMHDRIGYYLWWGITTWVTGIYTLVSQYMVNHPYEYPPLQAAALFSCGVFMIWLNWNADDQRQSVRETNGNTTIWGKKPVTIVAKYTTDDGVTRQSLLLVSGWWSISRHFNYIPEILLSLCWTLPAGFVDPLPYFYVVYLTILLLHRAHRDELRCRKKYKEYWDQYCKAVPYVFIPYVF
jgi:7-dehydrocholesterol reductase